MFLPKLSQPAHRSWCAAVMLAFSVCVPSGASAGQAPDSKAAVQEPQYTGQFFQLNADGTLNPLEPEKLIHESKTRNNFISVKTTGESIVPNAASAIRVTPGAKFVVRMNGISDTNDPNNIISLKPFVVEKNQRALPLSSAKVGFFQPMKGQTAADSSIAVTFKKYGESSYEVTPSSPLPPGEYALMTLNGAMGVSCFGVDAGLKAEPSGSSGSTKGVNPQPPGKAAVPTPKEPPIAWRIKPVARPNPQTEEYEATLPGLADAHGKHGAALLDVKCQIVHSAPALSPTLVTEMRVRRSMVSFDVSGLSCMFDNDGDYNKASHIQLGSEPEQTAQLCFDEELPADQNAIVPFTIDPGIEVIRAMAAESGKDALAIRVRVGDTKQDDLQTTFAHAQNASALLPVIQPCIGLIEKQRQAEAEAVVASCPALPGKDLSNVDVLVGPALKKLAVDGENDIGSAWDMPKITKAHPVRPKLSLACSYSSHAATGTASATHTQPEKRLVPIPASAAWCAYRSGYDKKMHGTCSRGNQT